MNFKKKTREVEEEPEKIRDKRNTRVNFTRENRSKEYSNRYDDASPNGDSGNEYNSSKSPGNFKKHVKDVEKKSPGSKKIEDDRKPQEKLDPKKKNQIQTMKVNMSKKEIDHDNSPKYNMNSKNPRKYSPPDESERENSPDDNYSNKRNKDYTSNNNDSPKKKHKKDTLSNNKTKSTNHISLKKDYTLKEPLGEEYYQDDEEEVYHYNNDSRNPEFENSNEEEDAIDEDDQKILDRRKNKNYRKLKSMFKPEVDKHGRLVVQNIESIKAIEEKSSSPQPSMQKMNRLSHILMSKSQEPANRGSKSGNNDVYNGSDKKEPRMTKGMFNMNKNGKGKFISITLAMLSSKGPNCEDRVFTRDMRVDKGGVIDLAQQQSKKPVKNYQIKKITNHRSPSGKPKVIRYNPKDREKAAKLVQFWWREILNRFKLVNEKITKIQAHYRGSLVRSYIFELLYFSLLAKNFVDKFEVPVKRHAKKYVINKFMQLFGDEIKDKFTILKIIKLQKVVKLFLANLRDKRKKFYFICEKIKYRYLFPFFKKIKNISPQNNKKYLKAIKFTTNLRKVILKNQFKIFIKDLARFPIKKLESRIKAKILKNHFNKMIILNLRESMYTWKNQAKKKYNPTAIKLLAEKVCKPSLKTGFCKIKAIPPKDLKDRLIRNLLNKANRYSDLILREFIKRWRIISIKAIKKDFENKVLHHFLHHTSKVFLKSILQYKFRKWHLGSIKLSNKNQYGNTLYKLEDAIKRHAFKSVIPKLNKAINGVRNKTVKKLLIKLPNMKLLFERMYFSKFLKICGKIRTIELSTNIIKQIGSKHFQKFLIKLINNKFQRWKNKVNMLKYVEVELQNGYDRRKILASSKLGLELQKFCKTKAQKLAFPKLIDHLIKSIKSRSVKSIIKLHPKLLRLLIKNFFRKWVDIENKSKINDFKNKVFLRIANNVDSGFRRYFIKKHFSLWYRNCPRNIAVKILNSNDILLNSLRRKYFKNVVNALSKKVNKELAFDKLLDKVKLKDVILRNKFSRSLFKWRNIIESLKNKDLKENLSTKILVKHCKKVELNKVFKRFNIWRQAIKVKSALINSYNKTKGLFNETRNLCKLLLKNDQKGFFNRLKKFRSNQYIRISLNKMVEYAFHSKEMRLRSSFNNWRLKLKDMKIQFLKRKFWISNFMNLEITNKKSKLINSLKTWSSNIRLDHIFKSNDKNVNCLMGFNLLKDMFRKRRFQAFLKVKDIRRLDHRGKLLFMVSKKLNRPKYEIGRCYEKWKRITKHYKDNSLIKLLKNKLLVNTCKQYASRVTNESKLRNWNKWRNIALNVNEKYFKKIEGINLLQHFIIQKYCFKEFGLIDKHKNYKKLLLMILPKKSKLVEHYNHNLLLKRWNQWKKSTNNRKNDILVSKIILGLSKNNENKIKNFIISKRFKNWGDKCFSKLNKRKLQLPAAVQGLKKITNTIENKFIPDFIKKLPSYVKQKEKNRCMKAIFFKSKVFSNRKLRNYFIKWWKINLLDINTIKLKIEEKSKLRDLRTRFNISNLKRLFIMNWILKPTEKYLKKWIKNSEGTYKSIRNGLNNLNISFTKKARVECMPKIKAYKSPNALKKALINKVLPKCKRLFIKFQKDSLMSSLIKWKRLTDRNKLELLRSKIFKLIYSKRIDLFKKYYLNKWKDRCDLMIEKERKKPLDLRSLRQGEMIFFKTVAKRLIGKHFFEIMASKAKFNFLRSLLLKTSKFHRKNLKQFIFKWNFIKEKLKAKELQARVYGKLLARMSHYHLNKDISNHVKNKINQWKENKNKILCKINEDIPKAIKHINKASRQNNFPIFKEKLLKIRMRHLRNAILFNRMKKNGALEKLMLKEFLHKWQDYVKKLTLKLMKNKIISLYLKNYQIRVNKLAMKHRLREWKEYDPTVNDDKLRHNEIGLDPRFDLKTRKERERILTCVTVGSRTLYKFFLKDYFRFYYKKIHLFNRKIPDGLNLRKALMFGDKGLAKNIAIKTLCMRPKYKLWNQYVEKCRENELKDKICFKVFNMKKMLGRVSMRKCVEKWKGFINKCVLSETEADLRTKTLRLVYSKNQRLFMFKKFLQWKNSHDKFLRNLERIHLGCIKLINKYNRITFYEFKKGIEEMILYKQKRTKAFNTLRKMVLSTDKGIKLFNFYKYKNICHKIKIMLLKHHIVKYVINKYESSTKLRLNNKQHEKFLRWYFMSGPSSTLEKISIILQAIEKLKLGLIKKYLKIPFNLIHKKAIRNKVMEAILAWASKWDNKANLLYVGKKFEHWIHLVKSKLLARKKLNSMFMKYKASPQYMSDNLLPLRVFKKHMQSQKENKAGLVTKIQNKFKEFQKKCRSGKISDLVRKINIKTSRYKKIIFMRWNKLSHMNKYEYSANVLQNFFKVISDFQKKRAENTKKLFTRVENHVKRTVYKKCMEYVKLMKRAKMYFKRWKYQKNITKRINAANVLSAIVKGFFTRRLVKLRLIRKMRINDVVIKLFSKHLNKRKLYFNMWKFLTKFGGLESSAKIIQDYVKKRISLRKYLRANRILYSLMKKYTLKRIRDAIVKASLYNKDRGSILFNILERRFTGCFNKIKEYARKRGQLIALRDFYPRFIESFRMYWTLFYIRRWKKNVEDDKLKKLLLLQNKIKGKMKLWKLKKDLKKYQLLEKIATKLSHDNSFLKKIFLKIWSKKANYLSMIKAANTVQSIWNGNTSRKNVDREVMKHRLKIIFRKLYLAKTKGEFIKMSDFKEFLTNNLEKMSAELDVRYSTNNMLALSNNISRNAILYQITKNKSYLDALSYKKEYFKRWVLRSRKYDEHAQIIQSKYRQYQAKKLLQLLIKIKEKLLSLMKKHIDSTNQKIYIALMTWKVKNENISLNRSAKSLQDYIKKNMIKKRLLKTQKFFKNGENSLISKRLKNFSRIAYLRKSIGNPYYCKFLNIFKQRYIQFRIKDILLKNYHLLDEKIKTLYLTEKLRLWLKQVNLINQKREESAVKIQSCFRRFKMKKLLNMMIDVKRRNLKLILKLTNQMEIKRGAYFQLWRKFALDNKYAHAAQVLQNYMNSIKDKITRKNHYIKVKKTNQGMKILNKLHDRITKNSLKRLKLYSKYSRSIELLSFLVKLQNKQAKHSIILIKKRAENNKNLFIKKVNFIQEMYRMYKQRTGFMKIINKFRKFRFLLLVIADKEKRILNRTFKNWKRNALGQLLNYSARVLQNFINYRIIKKMKFDKSSAMKMIKLLSLKKRNNDLSSICNSAKLKTFVMLIQKAAYKRLRNNVDYCEKLKYINKLFRLPKSVCQRILKRFVARWKDINEKIAMEEYFADEKGKHNEMIRNILEKKLKNLHEKYNNKVLFHLRVWSGSIKDINVKNAARTINNYISRKYNDLKARRKWMKLFLGECIKHHKYEMLNLNTRMKQYLRFKALYRLFTFKLNLLGFNNLKLKVHFNRIHQKLLIVFNNTHDRLNNMTTYYFWRKWRHVNSNLRQKDFNLIKLARIYNTRQQIDDFRILSHAFLIKRMMVLFKVILRRRAYDKIKIRSMRNSNFFKIGKALSKVNQDLTSQKNIISFNKLYSIYVFRVLKGFSKRIIMIFRRLKQENFNTLKDNIANMFLERSKYNYDIKKNFNKANVNYKNFKFTSKKNNKLTDKNVESDNITKEDVKKIQFQYVMPFFVKYINGLINQGKKYSFEKMKPYYKLNKLIKKIKTILNSNLKVSMRNFFNALKTESEKGETKKNLKKLLRKNCLLKFNEEYFKPAAKLLKLSYFIRLVMMHNQTVDDNFLNNLIKRWRFTAHVNKVSINKLQVLYKNMQLNYLNMADELFGSNREESNLSLVEDIHDLSEKIGMFSVSRERNTSIIKKKYAFPNLLENNPEKIKEEEINSSEREKKNNNLIEKKNKDINENNNNNIKINNNDYSSTKNTRGKKIIN